MNALVRDRAPLADVFNHISDEELRERVRAVLLRQALAPLVEPGGDPEALAIFDDPNECGLPDDQAIRWLLDRGVTPLALGSPYGLHAARVRFLSDGRYVPALLGDFALVFAIIGAGGICDAAAWCPASGCVGSRLGVGYALGQGQITRAGLGSTGALLRVWRDPLHWLQNHRNGIAIIDPVQAVLALADLNVEAEKADELTALLRIPPPRITFPDFVRTIS
jgi:hypothetical protein